MEKKHSASAKKLADVKGKGQVAKSQDVARLVTLAAGFELVNFSHEHLYQMLVSLFMQPSQVMALPFETAVTQLSIYALMTVGIIAATLMLIVILVNLAAAWAQHGFVFSMEPLKPNFSKLNPVNQVKQIFSMKKLWEIGSAIFKVIILFGVGLLLAWQVMGDVLLMGNMPIHNVWSTLLEVVLYAERVMLFILVFLAALDFIVQRGFYQKQHRMTDEEVKQEQKNQGGNPQIKSKLRQIAQSGPPQKPKPVSVNEIDNADLVVVNPTHIAIALSYKPDQMPLPQVVYKSEDLGASEAINYAQSKDIPVIRYIWLARSLHASTDVGEAIPRETIQAAAAVFRVLNEISDDNESDETQQSSDLTRNHEGIYELDM